MKIHEYQAKKLMQAYGVPIPRGIVTNHPEAARQFAQELGKTVVVKAQIHAGGRGKGGGVKLAKTPQEAYEYAKQIIGMQLVTPQTGEQGRKVKKVLVEEGLEIKRELYLGMLIDRASERVIVMGSEAGGMEIEQIAATKPELIIKEWIDPTIGFPTFQAYRLACRLNISGKAAMKAASLFTSLYRLMEDKDASLAEINPLVETEQGDIIALDAKMNFDDSGLPFHPEIEELRDVDEEEPTELEASQADLSYVKMDGNIGCMVNGAGLAMATMDIIKYYGGEPANFLDIGGSATKERVAKAFQIILSDPEVKAILINIFGGIVKCDMVAEGIIAAAEEMKVDRPMVVRLIGTNDERANQLLNGSSLKFQVAGNMAQAAEMVVKATKEA